MNHPILEFLHRHLDLDSFSGRMVWESVKDHHNDHSYGYYSYDCNPCQSWTYPCDRLREVLSFFSDAEDFDESWTRVTS